MTRIARVGDDAALLPSLALALSDPDVVEIVVQPGRYVEHVVIAPRAAPLMIRSATGDARDVTISFGLRQGDRDLTGMEFVQDCATLTVDADDVTLESLTIENSFDKRANPELPNVQALALRTRGDRFTANRCRFLGQQDTVLLDAPSYAAVRHAHLRDCEIEGDVDFVYGRATALIEGGVVRSVGRGYIAAPSTARENPRGFLFWNVDVVGDLEPGSVRLGRPWHPGGKPDAIGQALFAHCRLGAHISPEPWEEMGGFAWQDARFAEFGNSGPGAGGGPDRPHLDAAPDRASWLEGWTPAPVSPDPRIVVVSDSTASEYELDRAPRTGWAQRLAAHTGRDVRNLAVSGASTRSFIEIGALDEALELLRPGDLLLVGFGHNDPKPDDRFSDVFTEFEANLRRYLVGARARGARPVLLTPVERRLFDGERARSTHGGYPQRVRDLACVERVPLIDLTVATRAEWQECGPEASKRMFLWLEPGAWPGYPAGAQDDTHLSMEGADLVAGLVAAGLRSEGLIG
ncbi:pectinesterase family protein [Microbacterium trichothecenolyticum]|uniref:pectinesterase family protein n=1 Tax=Microbacterium trichothecenolyticum TaxID=69370 RepID=UPI0035BE12A6